MLDSIITYAQYIAALGIVPGLLWYFRPFARSLYRFATTYLGLTAVLIFLYLLVYAQVGTSLGLPYLFWHEDAWPRLIAATGATLLLALIGVNAYYLSPYPLVTGVRTRQWLRSEEAIRTSCVRFWRKVGRLFWRPLAGIAAKLSGSRGEPKPEPPTGIPPEALPAWDAAMKAALADWKASWVLAISKKAAKEAARPVWPREARKRAGKASAAATRAKKLADVARKAAEEAVNLRDDLVRAVSRFAAEQAAATQKVEQAAVRRATAEQANDLAAAEQAAAEQAAAEQDARRAAANKAAVEDALRYAANACLEASRFAERAARTGEKSRAAAQRAEAEATREDHYAADLAQAGWLDKAGFVINSLLFDWLVFTPAQNLVEPASEDVRRIQRFLRTCRTPFLLLLLAPAVLPRAFTAVPRGAPAMPSWISLFAGENAGPSGPALSVASTWPGWLIGLVVWIAGIVMGVAVVKAILRLSELPYRHDFKPVERFPGHRVASCARKRCPARGCPYGHAADVSELPSHCRARSEIRESIVVFFVCVFLFYVIYGNVHWVNDVVLSPPAFAIFGALGFLTVLVSFVALQRRSWQVPIVLILVGWFGVANNDRFKMRFENLSYDDARIVPLRARVHSAYPSETPRPARARESSPTDLKLVDDLEALQRWLQNRRGDADVVDGKPKLVVVAVSGGATRSAYWTATVLNRLEREIPGFSPKVRVMTGASGGMLGSAYYVVHRRNVELGCDEPRCWVEAVPTDSLTPLAKYMALSELWHSLNLSRFVEDRGIVLERDWPDLRFPLSELRPLEAAGRVPSLIFSPMIVEDGRRLLISNLDLDRSCDPGMPVSAMVLASGHLISDSSAGTNPGNYSLSALEFYRIFPEGQGLFLSTAVRMSASFPYVSPAVNLPTDPPRRVVDAGYYDNYGVEVVTAWIYQNRSWLAKNTSGVLLVQIRDSISVKERLDVAEAPVSFWETASRGFQFLTSPIDGVSSARSSSSSFRNDREVELLGDAFENLTRDGVKEPKRFFSTVIFENSASVTLNPPPEWPDKPEAASAGVPPQDEAGTDVSMSWYLTRAERRSIRSALPADPLPTSTYHDANARRDLINQLHAEVFRILPADGFELRLVNSLNDVSGIPTEGKNLIIVAAVNNVLRFRIFDGDGKMVVDTDEERQTEKARQIEDLRKQLESLWPPHEMTRSDKGRVVTAVTSIVGHAAPAGPERDRKAKRLEGYRNYERLQMLKSWWAGAGAR